MNESTNEKHIDVYGQVTERIIALLEKGVVPWRQPWTEAGMPKNLVTGKPYRGVNVLLLGSLGYTQNCFLTFRQVKEIGGSVRKGEKSHEIVYWNWIEWKNKKTKEIERIPMLKRYRVFNISQCEDISKELLPVVVERVHDPVRTCEEIIEKMPKRPEIRHEVQEAYYHRLEDYVNMPRPETFADSTTYYGTLFHELVHASGHPSRLNRKEVREMTGFGSEPYSIEELTAEIGASFLKSQAGIPIEHVEESASYIQHWLKRLREDKRFIVYASAQAQKAADYILNVRQLEKEVELPEEPDQAKRENDLRELREKKPGTERER